MKSTLVDILVLLASSFMLFAAIGILRMPDFFTRMHTATKAPSLRSSLILLSAAIHFAEIGITARALAIIFFIFLTTPVAAHILGRAAYLIKVPMCSATFMDAWKENLMAEQEGKKEPEENTSGSESSQEAQ